MCITTRCMSAVTTSSVSLGYVITIHIDSNPVTSSKIKKHLCVERDSKDTPVELVSNTPLLCIRIGECASIPICIIKLTSIPDVPFFVNSSSGVCNERSFPYFVIIHFCALGNIHIKRFRSIVNTNSNYILSWINKFCNINICSSSHT